MNAWTLPSRTRLGSAVTPPPSTASVPTLWTYVVPAVLISIVTIRWFEPGHFIAAGDVSPFIRTSLESEAGSFWGHQLTGAGGTSAEAGRLVEVFLIRSVRAVGGSELLAQRLLFVAVLVFAGLGAAHLCRVFLDRRTFAGLAALVAVMNPYILLSLPNLIFPLAVGSAGLLAGEILAPTVGRRSSVGRLVAGSIPIAYLSINPPLVVVVVAVCLAATLAMVILSEPGQRLESATPVLVAGAVSSLVHLWWLLPFAIVTLRGPDGVRFGAVTDPHEWAWVSEQSSLDRVMTLTAHWGWPHPEFFPWAASLDVQPWVSIRWLLPIGALGGVLLAKRSRRGALFALGSLAVVLIVFSQGLHPPGSAINRFLFEHAPGWWLFRDPTSKFGVLLVLVYAVLFTAFVEHVVALASKLRRWRAVLLTVLASAVALTLVHPHPLLTGLVIPADRGELPSSHVALPSDWNTIASSVADSPSLGKVAVLPLNENYQVTTNWGYHGVDIIPQLFDRPVLQRLPGGYYEDRDGFATMLEAFESAVRRGDGVAADHLMDSLGASHLVVRHDVDDPRSLAGQRLGDVAASMFDELLVVDTEVATLYERDLVDFVRVEATTVGAPSQAAPEVVERTGDAVIDPLAGPDSVAWVASAGDEVHFDFRVFGRAAAATLDASDGVPVEVRLGERRLDVGLDRAILVDRRELELAPIVSIPTGPEPIDAVSIDGELSQLEDDLTTVVRDGATVSALSLGEPIELVDRGPLGDCNRFDERRAGEVGLSVAGESGTVVLRAAAHAACVVFPIPAGPTAGLLELEVATVRGSPARLCVWAPVEGRCIVEDIHGPDRPTSWSYALPAQSRREDLELYVYADGADDGSVTETSYGPVMLSPLRSIGDAIVDLDRPIATASLGSGEQALSLEERDVLGPFGELGDCHKIDDTSPEEAGLGVTRSPDSLILRAASHAACTWAPIDAIPGASLVVRFDATSISGAAPRFCLWQAGVNRCASAVAVETETDGSVDYRHRVQTDPLATELQLYLYADGLDGAVTEIEYRDIGVVESSGIAVTLRTGRRGTTPQAIAAERRNSGHYDVAITGVDGSFMLVLPESFSEGWSIEGLPTGWSATHIIVDGYANGWWITGRGDVDLGLRYAPGTFVQRAPVVSLVTPFAAMTGVMGHRMTSRRVARHGRGVL